MVELLALSEQTAIAVRVGIERGVVLIVTGVGVFSANCGLHSTANLFHVDARLLHPDWFEELVCLE
jgi:hypothetical protein